MRDSHLPKCLYSKDRSSSLGGTFKSQSYRDAVLCHGSCSSWKSRRYKESFVSFHRDRLREWAPTTCSFDRWGHAMIVDPYGSIVAQCPDMQPYQPTFCMADIVSEKVRPTGVSYAASTSAGYFSAHSHAKGNATMESETDGHLSQCVTIMILSTSEST